MSNCDTNLKELVAFLSLSGNKTCADCGDEGVSVISVKYGVFLCQPCGQAHRLLYGNIKKIPNIANSLEKWSPTDLLKIRELGGNKVINQRLEAELPVFVRRPWNDLTCPMFFREAFVKSKYIHEDFTTDAHARGAQSQFACSFKSGMLLKKMRDSNTFCDRFFELSIEGNYLRYFIKPGDIQPKQSLDLERLNFTFISSRDFDVPPHTALVQFVQGGSTRHIFIRSEDSQTIINWYNTVRLGKYHRLCLGLSGMGVALSPDSVNATITRDIDIAGWLSKTGPRKNDAWRRRWCMVFKRHLLYTDQPLSAFAKGEIFLGSEKEGYSLSEDAPEGWKRHSGFAFTINTSSRPFVFFAETIEEREKWMGVLKKIISEPLTVDQLKQAVMISTKRVSAIDYLRNS